MVAGVLMLAVVSTNVHHHLGSLFAHFFQILFTLENLFNILIYIEFIKHKTESELDSVVIL